MGTLLSSGRVKTNLVILMSLFIYVSPGFSNNLLEGHWIIPCRDGLKKQQVFRGAQVTTIESFHKDRNCQNLSFEFETIGFNEFPAQNLMWINFTYAQINLKVFVDEVIADFNERKVCGVNNWKSGEVKNITGRACAMFNYNKPTQIPRIGDQKFGVYSLDEDKLFYGVLSKEFDGSAPDKRPKALNPEFYIKN